VARPAHVHPAQREAVVRPAGEQSGQASAEQSTADRGDRPVRQDPDARGDGLETGGEPDLGGLVGVVDRHPHQAAVGHRDDQEVPGHPCDGAHTHVVQEARDVQLPGRQVVAQEHGGGCTSRPKRIAGTVTTDLTWWSDLYYTDVRPATPRPAIRGAAAHL
jgi:hypothetical protein